MRFALRGLPVNVAKGGSRYILYDKTVRGGLTESAVRLDAVAFNVCASVIINEALRMKNVSATSFIILHNTCGTLFIVTTVIKFG